MSEEETGGTTVDTDLAGSEGLSADFLNSLGIETNADYGQADAAPTGDAEVSEEEVEASPSEEPTVDELVEEGQAESAPETFEIVHDGVSRNLTLEELKSHAQKGFDYTTKTMTLAEQRKEYDAQALAQANELKASQELIAKEKLEMTDLYSLRDQWDLYINHVEKTDPTLFEELKEGFQSVNLQYNNPVVSAHQAATNKEMAELRSLVQSQQDTLNMKDFNRDYDSVMDKYSDDLKHLGLDIDKKLIEDSWASGAKTAEDALRDVYGKQMFQLAMSKGKLAKTERKATAAKKVPTAGTAKVGKGVDKTLTRTTAGRLRGWNDSLVAAMKEMT